jgi:peptidoglycan/LPS O-acetylase OafA/YrhL
VSLGLTLAAAWLFYLVVERPAQRWSSAIRYGVVGKAKTPRESEATGPVVTGIADP